MITEDFVSFEIAKLLKEKGFDETCSFAFYKDGSIVDRYDSKFSYNYYDRPTIQIAMKWLRKYSWVICIIPLTFYCGEIVSEWGYNIWADDNLEFDEGNTPKFKSYEEACEAAIKYCLENLI